jgi:hypothetical protein
MFARSLIAAAALLAASVPAAAVVTYDFTLGAGNSFSYVSPTFITGNIAVPASALASCTSVIGTCLAVGFESDAAAQGAPGYSAIAFGFDTGSGTEFDFSYFAGPALQTPGFYNELLLGNGATLTVSVPEPSTWALMIVGFGMAGLGVRRRAAAAAV